MLKGSRLLSGAAVFALATATLAACTPDVGGEGAEGETVKVSLLSPVPPSVFFFPGFVADELGYFEEEGISFRYETIGEDVSTTSLLVNGQVNVAAPGATEVIQGLEAGQELSVVYDYYKLAAEGIVVPAYSDIQSVADLEGTTVGIAGDEVRSLLAVALDTAGLSLDDVEVANVVTGGSIIINSLETGAIDSFVGGVIDFAGLEAAGFSLRAITPEELASVPPASLTVTPEYAENQADVLTRFLRAWSKGLHAGLANPMLAEVIMREVSPEEWEDEAVGLATLNEAIRI